jgi:hypothetical protein
LIRVALTVGLCLIAAIAGDARAQASGPGAPPAEAPADPHAVQPERPTLATHAGTVAPGWLEIESGIERDRFAPSDIGYITPTLLKFGIANRLQLGVFGALGHPAPGVTGIGDVGAGVKWRLVEGAPIVGDFALLPSVKLPTGSAASGTGTGTTDVSLLAISSHDLGPVALDINVGYTKRSGDGLVAPTSASLWTVSTGGPFAGALGWVLECYGYPGTGGPSGQAPIVAVLAGPTFLAKSWLAFDAGAIVPVKGAQPHALYAGVVYNVGRLWGGGS